MFIYDSAGKEIFADHVPQFVRALLCACCPLMSTTLCIPPSSPCSGSTPRWWWWYMMSPMNSPSRVVQNGWRGSGLRNQNSHFQVQCAHPCWPHPQAHPCWPHPQAQPCLSYPCAGVLVANKTDLPARRVVGEAAGRNFAAEKGLQYFECSAVSPQWWLCSPRSSEQSR